jgi:tRNA(His) guanylyltransferase
MRFDEFDERLRKFEWLGEAKVPPESYIILRLDGVGFSKFTANEKFAKPVDENLHRMMLTVASKVVDRFDGVFATTHSDEISVLLPQNFELYNRELAKLVSVSAGIASSTFTSALFDHALHTQTKDIEINNKIVAFDSRVWCSENPDTVLDYFAWRSADAARCSLNGFAFWTLRKQGLSARAATSKMDHATNEFKHEVLFNAGINWAELPWWQKNGTALFWETYEKEGFNPMTKEKVTCTRRRIADVGLPGKDIYPLRTFFKKRIFNDDSSKYEGLDGSTWQEVS